MSTIKANTLTAADLNTDLTLKGSGTGKVVVGDGSLVLPDADGTAGQFLQTNGSGTLSFADAGGGLGVYAAGEVVSGSTTFSRAVWTDVTFTETADSGTTFNGTTFTVPTGEGGVYELIAWVEGDYNSIGNDGEGAGIRFDKNGGTILAEANFLNLDQADRNQLVSTAYMGSLAAGDTIVVEAKFIDGNASGSATLRDAGLTIKKVA
jgi:hypothetical protein